MELSMSGLMTHLVSTRDKYFASQVLNAVQRVPTESIPTMAVGLRRGKILFMYNPEFLKQISFELAVAGTLHETYHLLFDHIPRYLELLALFIREDQKRRVTSVFNIAADCVCNSFIRFEENWASLEPQFHWILPEKYELPQNESFDLYMAELLKKVSNQPQGKGGGGQGQGGVFTISPNPGETPDEFLDRIEKEFKEFAGNHENWQNTMEGPDGQKLENMSPGELQSLAEQVRSQAKHIIRKAVNDVRKAHGNVPSALQDWLETYLADPVIPWWEVFKSKAFASRRTKPIRTIERPNRALMVFSEEDPTILPSIGRTYDESFRIFAMLDVSGSMDNESVEIALNEIEGMMKTDEDIEVRVLQGDTEVHSDELYTGKDKLPRVRNACGGTSFDAYFEYMQKYTNIPNQSPDLVVVLTDGGCNPVSDEFKLPHNVPVLWLIINGGYQHLEAAGYGEVIVCDPRQNKDYDS